MNLADFLFQAPRDTTPWNCSTFPADWCVALGHPDFAAPWRQITDPVECEEIASGRLLSLWETGIGDALPVANKPYQPGDIGIVSKFGLEAGAIFDGAMWALRLENKVAFARLDDDAILKAWRP